MEAAAAQAQRRRSEDERARALHALEQAHQRLVDADRRKDEFLAMLGHELRNPLAAIANAAQVLRRSQGPASRAARLHEIIARQSSHLARVLDDLLDVARITYGKMTLRLQPLALDALARRVLQDQQDHPGRRTLALECGALEPVTVRGDEVRLAQVLSNLLDNAVKYTPDGGRIVLSVVREGDLAVVRLSDTGMGIPAALLAHLFEPFTQNAQSIERSQGGLGLGLAIVRRIVERHGGTIEVRSAGAGQGTDVEVRLPVLADALPA